MDNEVKETLELSKSTVGVRFELPKRIHRKAMAIHKANPRTWNFEATMIDIVEEGCKAIAQRKSNP